MEAYIGAKVILAEEMDECTFLSKFKSEDTENRETRPGYHVVYANPNGRDYDSWSPRDVFEEAYRKISDSEKKLINH